MFDVRRQLLTVLAILIVWPSPQAWCADPITSTDQSPTTPAAPADAKNSSPRVPPSGEQWGAPEGRFRLAATLDRVRFAPGEPVIVSLWLKNDSPERADWRVDRGYHVEVYDTEGEPVEPSTHWLTILIQFGFWLHPMFDEDSFRRDYAAGDVRRQFELPLHLLFDLSREGNYEARIVPLKFKHVVMPLPGEPTLKFEITPAPAESEPVIVNDVSLAGPSQSGTTP